MIERAWLVQSLLVSDDELKEENGTHHKIAVAGGKEMFTGNSHFYQFKKRNFR